MWRDARHALDMDTIVTKKQMTEVKLRFITPAMGNAGWDGKKQNREEIGGVGFDKAMMCAIGEMDGRVYGWRD